MLDRFICPDGGEVEMANCLHECRLGKRCLTKPTLMVLSDVREWSGVPSVTQLLNGTMQSFLQITESYAESPQTMAYRLVGTTVHAALDPGEYLSGCIIEQRIEGDGITGQADILEWENNWHVLTDYKTSGSYKVSEALGVSMRYKKHPTAIYQKKTRLTINGEKRVFLAGQPKMIKDFYFDIRKQRADDWVLQLNKYRIDLEKKYDIEINELRVQAILKDAGLMAATMRGLDQYIYIIPIPIIDNDKVRNYFIKKRDELLKALENNEWNELCTLDERWNGRRCQDFCPVKKFCKYER